jgi:hypothetical protein
MCPILTEFGDHTQIFIKVHSTKFHVNFSIRNRAVTYGQTERMTDKHDEGNRHFSRLCEGAYKRGLYRQ